MSGHYHCRRAFSKVALLISLALLSQAAYAAVRLVPRDYATVQAAINAAANGDVVIVSPGRYIGGISFKGKSIIVRSTAPNSVPVVTATILDGNLVGRVVNFTNGETSAAVLSGFTITRGKAAKGAGIYAYGASPTISYCLITGNRATGAGGGVYYAGGGSIIHNVIRNNTAGANGGGVNLEGYPPRLTQNVIQGNRAQSGAGIATNFANPLIADNVIMGNQAVHRGGGILIMRNTANIVRNVIIRNSAPDGGAGLLVSLATATAGSNTFSNNTLSAAILSQSTGSIVLKNSIVAFNPAGAVSLQDDGNATIRYCDFYGNGASQFSGTTDAVVGLRGNISADPLFVNIANNDFHEKSWAGHYNLLTGTWVSDAVNSPCIDKGDPAGLYSLEPLPNGDRLNMGAYGNTAQASKGSPPPAPGRLALQAVAAPLTNGGASVAVTLSTPAAVQLTVLNMAGQQIAAVPAQDLPSGLSNVLWSGRSSSGTRLPAGMFMLKLTACSKDGTTATALQSLYLKR